MAPSVDELKRMTEASGAVASSDPVVGFLYLLARDEVPLGRIENLLDAVVDLGSPTVRHFTNGWLARWAEDARDRLEAKRGRAPADA